MKKAKRNVFFMAQVHHGVDEICSNGDVPSNQRRRLDFDSLMRKSTLAESNIIESGRAEQSTKVIGF
jgi:hypothetical protein